LFVFSGREGMEAIQVDRKYNTIMGLRMAVSL